MQQNIFTFKIRYKGKIPSVNQLYLTGRSGKKIWTYINPIVTEYRKLIEAQLKEQNIENLFLDYLDKEIGVEVNLSFVINKYFWRRDVSNLVKATEDAIVNAGKIDDRYNLIVDSRKILNDVDEFEYLIVVIKIMKLDQFKYKWSQYVSEN